MTAPSSKKVARDQRALKPRRASKPGIPGSGIGKSLSRALIRKAFHHLCVSSQTSRGLRAWVLFDSEEYEQLLRTEIRPQDYLDAATYYLDARIYSFFKKYADLPVTIDRKGPALEKWRQAEARCRRVNDCFRARSEGKFLFSPLTEHVLRRASEKISFVLGRFPVERVVEECRHGPGADLGTRRNETAAYWKYAPDGHCTPGCLTLMHEWFHEYHVSDLADHSVLTNANRLSFVPKTSLIDRIICVEPRWNVFLQLGIGEAMSRRLREKAGVDIRDQGRNQALASAAYRDQLATIDLSAASDSVAKNLVLELLPDDWFDALAKTRSPFTILPDGEKVLNEKFSSMGNGYTFPLETLLFWAITTSVVESQGESVSEVGVYGDDIIAPSRSAHDVIGVLRDLGFETNESKTFTEGYFYESCGMDYYKGVPVRPFYLREEPKSWAAVVEFVNGLCFCDNGHPGYARDWALHSELCKWLTKRAPVRALPRGPEGANGTLWEEHHPTIGNYRGWEGIRLHAWVFRPRGKLVYHPVGLLLSKLGGQGGRGHLATLRGEGEWTLKKVFFPSNSVR